MNPHTRMNTHTHTHNHPLGLIVCECVYMCMWWCARSSHRMLCAVNCNWDVVIAFLVLQTQHNTIYTEINEKCVYKYCSSHIIQRTNNKWRLAIYTFCTLLCLLYTQSHLGAADRFQNIVRLSPGMIAKIIILQHTHTPTQQAPEGEIRRIRRKKTSTTKPTTF